MVPSNYVSKLFPVPGPSTDLPAVPGPSLPLPDFWCFPIRKTSPHVHPLPSAAQLDRHTAWTDGACDVAGAALGMVLHQHAHAWSRGSCAPVRRRRRLFRRLEGAWIFGDPETRKEHHVNIM